jgi:hypothetical protein
MKPVKVHVAKSSRPFLAVEVTSVVLNNYFAHGRKPPDVADKKFARYVMRGARRYYGLSLTTGDILRAMQELAVTL